MNGIAYNKATDTFYLTGKNWPVMFEVNIPE
ncbi:glutaminyl-peptide cyclotransferase [Acidobacteriota bacterium]